MHSFDANGWGLHVIHGNVWEWVQDAAEWDPERDQFVIDPYLEEIQDPVSTRGSNRVLRGGSWYSNASYCRLANRIRNIPDNRIAIVGFRLVKTAG